MESWDIATLGVEPHQPQVLRSDPGSRAIAINLPAGERMQEHRTREAAYVIVAAGEVEIEADGGTATTAGPGFVAHFAPKEDREVRATSDARLVLILEPWPADDHRGAGR